MRIPAGTLLAVWLVLGIALGTLAVLAWTRAEEVQGCLRELQLWYGTGPDPMWLQRSDTQTHIVVSFLATCWFGVGCRLFLPRLVLWLSPGLTILLALFDELAQLGSEVRHFEWSDQAGDATGLLLAIPVLLWVRRLEVTRPASRQLRK